jgi:Calcineurin-like phosphoesterase/Purple acid Phosphatase, N-terminal domain/FlgD Ig-like domain
MRHLILLAMVGLCIASTASAHPGIHEEIASLAAEATSNPSAPAFLALAEMHRLAGEHAAAAAALDRAAALDARAPGLDLCRAALAWDRGRPSEARAALARHRARFAEDPRGLELSARIRSDEGDFLGAAVDLGHALEHVSAPNPDLFVRRAHWLLAAGPEHGDAALAALEDGIARLGAIPSLEAAAVEVQAAHGDLAGALARLDRMAARLERPGAWLLRRARLQELQGDAEGAAWTEAAARAAAADRRTLPAAAPSPAAPRLDAPGAAPARIQAALTRGPYLCSGGPSRITVRWRTDVATDGRVRYGTSLANLNLTVYDPLSTTEHVITLSGLAADTRYYYSIGTGTVVLSGGDAATSFLTSPAAGVAKPTRLWVIGDSGSGTTGAAQVRDAWTAYAAITRPADLWLMLGDNAYSSGTDAEYQAAVFNMYPALLRSTVLWPTRGNHDVLYSGANNDYYDLFTLPTAGEMGGLSSGTEAYYSFDYGDIHFICLDSEGSDRSVGGPMAVWLRADLAATPRDWVIAYWHHPPYTKGSHDSDNDLDSGARMGEMRRNILPILDSTGVDVVLSGHSHDYERSFLLDGHYGISTTLTDAMKIDPGDGRWNGDGAYAKPTLGTGPREGAVYVVDGVGSQTGGGALNHPVMISSLDVLGSLVIDVAGNRLDARFLDTQRVVRDSFTIVKGAPVAVHPEPAGSAGLRVLSAQPSRGAVRLGYRLARAGRTRIVMLDAVGRRVRMVRSIEESAGEHEVVWSGEDDAGRICAAGVYFAVLEAEGRSSARKIVHLGR